MNITRTGWTGILCEVASQEEVHRLAGALSSARSRGCVPFIVDIVPAARTVLLVTEARNRDEVYSWVVRNSAMLESEDAANRGPRVVDIPVRYDGHDLREVARLTGMTPDEVIDLHVSAHHLVAFLGFAPGWAYIEGVPNRLRLARRPSPRSSVPAGSVCIAGGYTGIYPRESPSGWHVIGTTEHVLWDAEADPPSSLEAGMRVQFHVA